jgi:hypothetical protein
MLPVMCVTLFYVPQLWSVFGQHLKRLYDDTPYPIIFSPTSSATTYDLMWPDFSFMPPNGEHELRTPRWDIERQNVLKAGREIRWEDKLDFAAFTGSSGPIDSIGVTRERRRHMVDRLS